MTTQEGNGPSQAPGRVGSWPSARFQGEAQSIPGTCPNCLQPSTTSLRYHYQTSYGFLNPTKYFQTFNYCDSCAVLAKAGLAHRSWMARMTNIGVVIGLWIATLLFCVFLFLEPGFIVKVEQGTPAAFVVMLVLPVVLTLASIFAVCRWSRRRLNAAPKKIGQAIHGVAVFYTGGTFFGLMSGFNAVYRAARPEWLKELVAANAEQVDDATHRRWLGTEKPPTSTQRPFR